VCVCVYGDIISAYVCWLAMISIPPRDTSPHQDSTGTVPSGTPPPAQQPPPPQTRKTQSHSVPTPLKRPMLTPERGPRPRASTYARRRWSVLQKTRCAYGTQWCPREIGISLSTAPDVGLQPWLPFRRGKLILLFFIFIFLGRRKQRTRR